MNRLILALIIPLTAFFVFSGAVKTSKDNIISWGVNPNSQERTPEPPKGSEKMLKENNGMFVGNTNEKKVYFTFDLGYEAGFTEAVLDILQENNIKAVFFICGNYLKEKNLIDRMINEGHRIGNHTDRHKDLPKLSDENIRKDIADLQTNFESLYGGVPMKFFRPPQGRFSERVLKIVNEEGLKTMLWSIAIVDWGKTPINAETNADKILKRLHPGAIILSHITNSGTPEMLKLLLKGMAGKGYIAGEPDELI